MFDGASPGKPQLSIAMVGTRGVPARYGGFETAVEEIGQRLVKRGHQVRVYCRSVGGGRPPGHFRGMELVGLPAVRRRSLETLSHTGVSALHLAWHRTDVAFVFNSANAPWLPVLRGARIPVATHVDGLEWQRAKWGTLGRRYYRLAESAAVALSDALIADAQGIAEYYRDEFGAKTELISYGSPALDEAGAGRLHELGLEPEGYHLVVARFEPENHLHLIVDGFVRSKAARRLVVVGSAPYADAYTAHVRQLAADDPRVTFTGALWDQQLLDQLYANALTYIHGHSVGGTNPSLLRALGAGAPSIAYDVNFNHEVLQDAGVFFTRPSELTRAIETAEANLEETRSRGRRSLKRALDYDWDEVADGYETLAWSLATRRVPGPQHWGRRRSLAKLPAVSVTPTQELVNRR